jgi:O-acetyl-ADP-ribose deacetylase (regulator of RNase III)
MVEIGRLLIFLAVVAPISAPAALFCTSIFRSSQKETVMSSADSTVVSMDGTVDNGEIRQGRLPRGSALWTSSGALKNQGITGIIHAASGSMMHSGGHNEPSLNSVGLSVANSVRLAELHGAPRIAIPFVGGKIFVERIGVTPHELAKEIIRSAVAARGEGEIEIRFVLFGAEDYGVFMGAYKELSQKVDMSSAKILEGSITDFSLHGSPVIVNAANTEVIFGGGLSGLIGRATQSIDAINQEAAAAIRELNRP